MSQRTLRLPYNCLQIADDVLFAARGGRIHSFRLADGSHLSTWQHPDVDSHAAAVNNALATSDPPAATDAAPDNESPDQGPPAKRQRLSADDTAVADKLEEAQIADKTDADGKRSRNSKKDVAARVSKSLLSKAPDRPVIALMTATADAKHLVAVSGHDKTIWVFELGAHGQLTQLSQRSMPKRPSSILVTPDDQTILSADKFGDVYSLPLLPSATPAPQPTSPLPANTPSAPTEPAAKRPSATTLTVHSKSNRTALENQLRNLQDGDKRGTPRLDAPAFACTLQLGHVSMVTALALAAAGPRRYILTADRDEHIRVSRFLPHAHVIEGFCLGHAQFVSALAVHPRWPATLVSGGGDPALFVWDWVVGEVRAKVDLLEPVRAVLGADAAGEDAEAPVVAVAGLYAATRPRSEEGAESEAVVVAICESVPALFTWSIGADFTLHSPQTVALDGNPLHVAVCEGSGPALVVATDSSTSESSEGDSANARVAVLYWDAQGRLSRSMGNEPADKGHFLQDAHLDADQAHVSGEEIRSLFYTVANLRKQPLEGREEE